MKTIYVVTDSETDVRYLVEAASAMLAQRYIAETVLMRLSVFKARPVDVLKLMREGVVPLSTQEHAFDEESPFDVRDDLVEAALKE